MPYRRPHTPATKGGPATTLALLAVLLMLTARPLPATASVASVASAAIPAATTTVAATATVTAITLDGFVLTVALVPPPPDGMAAMTLSVALPDGWAVTAARSAAAMSAMSAMSVTYRSTDGRADILLDAAGNIPLPPTGEVMQLTVKSSTPPTADAIPCVLSACLYTYNKEGTITAIPLPGGDWPLAIPGNAPSGDTEGARPTEGETSVDENGAVNENGAGDDITEDGDTESTGTENTDTESTGTEATGDHTASEPSPPTDTGARYVGCRETVPREGTFAVQFLFSVPTDALSGARDVTAYPIGGGGPTLTLTATVANTLHTVDDGGTATLSPPSPDGRPRSWYILTFAGLSDACDYRFTVATGGADRPTVTVGYRHGVFQSGDTGG